MSWDLVIPWVWYLTCDFERSYFLRSSLVVYNLEISLRYSHSFLRYWPWNLLPRPASYRYKCRGEYSKPICDCRWNSFISHNLPRTFQFWNNQSPHLQYIDFENSRKRAPFSTSGDLTNQTEIETWEYQADVPWATDYDRLFPRYRIENDPTSVMAISNCNLNWTYF